MRLVAEASPPPVCCQLPRLPGHGTTVEDMITTGWPTTGEAEAAYQCLAARCDQVVAAVDGGSPSGWLPTNPEIAGIVHQRCHPAPARRGADMGGAWWPRARPHRRHRRRHRDPT
jgi:hypothetical protein